MRGEGLKVMIFQNLTTCVNVCHVRAGSTSKTRRVQAMRSSIFFRIARSVRDWKDVKINLNIL